MYEARCLALLYAHPEAHRGCPSPSRHNPSCFLPSRAHLPGSVLSNNPTRPSCVLAALDSYKLTMAVGKDTVTYAPRVLHFSAFHLYIVIG